MGMVMKAGIKTLFSCFFTVVAPDKGDKSADHSFCPFRLPTVFIETQQIYTFTTREQ